MLGVSSISGNVGPDTGNLLQLAPSGSDGPSFGDLKTSYEMTMADSQSFTDQCRQNYLTRFALWAGQSSDGKKHAREGSKVDPTPWEGSSDLRIYDVDGVINKKVALYRSAFKKANITASPIHGNDFKRARIVSNFMRWLVHTQIPDIDREVELLANFILEKGVAATGQFWETKQEKKLTSVSIPDLQQKFPNVDIVAILMDEAQSQAITDAFETTYGASPAKAKKMLADLRKKGKTTVATLGRLISRPVLRAFDISENLFIPPDTTDIERATGIYRIEYYTPEALRAFVNTDGWDKAWVEKAIETCRGKQITLPPSQYMNPMNRSFVYTKQTFMENQVGVVYAYQRLSDEDGVAGVYQTIFSPILPDDADQPGYAKFGLLEYAHGNYPFVLFRREFLTRRLHDTRGIPEPGKSFQDVIKAHRDGRIDAASIAIIPPLGFPMGRAPSRWGPGARIPERRPGEYHFLDRPQADPLTENSEVIIKNGLDDYFGFNTPGGDPQYVQAQTQHELDKFLSGLAKAYEQIYQLNAQYGDDKVDFQVMGVKDPEALSYVKSDVDEMFHWYLIFDSQSMDTEQMKEKWAAIVQGIQLLDRDGNVNFAAAIQAYIESIDPVIAERILDPTTVGKDRIMKDEVDDLTKIFAGFNVPVKPTTPPQIGMQVLQTYMQSPDVQARYGADKDFKARIDARAAQYRFQGQQRDNAQIGRQGAALPGPAVAPATNS